MRSLFPNKKRVFPVLAMFVFGLVVVGGGYFVTSQRSFDDRGRASAFYVVKYDGNGGTCKPTRRRVEQGGIAEAPTCTRPGYTFAFFTKDEEDSYHESINILNARTGRVRKVHQNLTITANWVAESSQSYLIKYDGNGGTCTPSSLEVKAGGIAAAPTCTRPGYTLAFFTKDVEDPESESTNILNARTGRVSEVYQNLAITAHWVPETSQSYLIKYDGNGGTCTPSFSEVAPGGTSVAPSCTFPVNDDKDYIFSDFTRIEGTKGDFDSQTGVVSNVNGHHLIRVNWKSDGTQDSCTTTSDCEKHSSCCGGICYRGDIDGNGLIDMVDFQMLRKAYTLYQSSGWTSDLASSDLNGDKRISLEDHSIFVHSYSACNLNLF